ncbi:MAG TPA: ABC transporter ATP-binding protein [Nitratifractor sp.]|nr:ABC transporter ATP-binding protein [Nitratifractor sp.]
MNSGASIEIKELQKRYDNGFVALKGVDLKIESGEFLVIVGPSGCGKSTLLRMIAGLEDVEDGEIIINRKIVNDLSPSKRDIAMVFQSYALYPHLSSFENIATPLYIKDLNFFQKLPIVGRYTLGYKGKKEEISQKVKQIAQTLSIEELLDKKPSKLSGGQRQRVAIGRAMVRNPKVFLMDEPLSNLDAKLRVHMRAEISALHRKLGSTFVYVTHDQSEAMTLGSRIAMMHEGQLLQIDTPDEIYNNPRHLRVAEFIGSPKINTLSAEIAEDGFIRLFGKSIGIECPNREQENITIAIRPEALKLASEDDKIKWSAKVYHKENLGAYLLFYIEVEKSEKAVVRVGIGKDFNPEIGEEFFVKPTLKSIFVFDEAGERLECKRDEDYES